MGPHKGEPVWKMVSAIFLGRDANSIDAKKKGVDHLCREERAAIRENAGLIVREKKGKARKRTIPPP